MSPLDFHKLASDFSKLRAEQESRSEKYEASACWAMAYLCQWVILEKTIKAIYGARVRVDLREQLKSWLNYLDDEESSNVPSKIQDFSINPINIPSIKSIEKEIGAIPNIKEVMASDAKWRKKRNAIAHNTDDFGKETTYREYKNKLSDAVKELDRQLTSESLRKQ